MNQNKRNFSVIKRLKSFKHAYDGLKSAFSEHNFKIHIAIAFLVIVAGVLLNISKFEWLIIVLTISLVIICEIINTAIEKLADFISPQWDDKIKVIKDLAAAAVLISATAAFLVGLIIFVPKI